MPYTRVTACSIGRRAIAYAQGGKKEKGHNGHKNRNIFVTSVNMLPNHVVPFADQMQPFWDKASYRHINEVRRLIVSFSRNEISPKDPNAGYIAGNLVAEYLKQTFPNRQAAIFIAIDGKAGLVHAHAIINDVDMQTNKAMGKVYLDDPSTPEYLHYKDLGVVRKNKKGKEYIDTSSFMFFKNTFDSFAADHINLDLQAEKTEKKYSRYERYIQTEQPASKTAYIWKDDLRDRIRSAMSMASSRDDYVIKLSALGIKATYKSTKKAGDFILYELTDTSRFEDKIPPNLKSKSYKLGDEFGIEALDKFIDRNMHLGVGQSTKSESTMQNAEGFDDPNDKQEIKKPTANRSPKGNTAPAATSKRWPKRNGKISTYRAVEEHCPTRKIPCRQTAERQPKDQSIPCNGHLPYKAI